MAAVAEAGKAGSGKSVSAAPEGGFAVGQVVVYPSHGLARVQGVEQDTVAGYALRMLVLVCERDRMKVRIPLAKVRDKGVRHLADEATIARATAVLTERPKAGRGLWSRRAADYEAKICAGGLVAIAEVARDCFRSETDEDASYSMRRIFAVAIERLAAEVACVRGAVAEDVRASLQASMEAALSSRGRTVGEAVSSAA